MPEDIHSVKRRAVDTVIDNRSMIDMEQLKSFISVQNKELQDTINKNLQETIDNNNKANMQSLENILDKKLDIFAGYVDTKIEGVRSDCLNAVQLLSDQVEDKIDKFSVDVEDRIDYLERQAKLCDVVIKNIPYRHDENMSNYVYNLCDVIRYNNTNSIKAAFRLSRNQSKSNPIIMKFYDVADKRDFMHAYFQCQNLNLSDLGFKTKLRIVISEALTHKNNEIFKKAMQLKFDKVFWSVSTKSGLVYYRLDQKDKPSRISSLSSLNAFNSAGAKQDQNQNHGTTNQQANQHSKQPLAPLHNAGETLPNANQLDQSMVNASVSNTETTSNE